MKETIKEGIINKTKYANTCPHCHCQYLYQKEDVIPDIFSGIPHVYCPCCGKCNTAAILPGSNYTMFI